MATVNKDFRVKNGLVVEGSTATVNGNNVVTDADTTDIISEGTVNLYFTDQRAIDAVTGGVDTDGISEGTTNLYFTDEKVQDVLVNAVQENIAITSTDGLLYITAENGVEDSTTDDLDEGTVNLYFTDQRAIDAVAGGTFSTDVVEEGTTNLYFTDQRAIDAVIDGAVDTDDIEEGTTNLYFTDQRAIDAVIDGSVDTDDIEEGTVNLYFTQQRARDSISGGTGINYSSTDGIVYVDTDEIATKTYVDTVAEGLHIHASVNVATDEPIADTISDTVTYNNEAGTLTLGTALTQLDDVTLTNGMRILVKNENGNLATNGIYTWATGGTVLTRALDFNTATEIAGGDFTFVTGGTKYNNTGWVQTEAVNTMGDDAILWSQFSGAGTFTGGTGIDITAQEISVDFSEFDTDDITEGTTNLYYTTQRVYDDLVNSVQENISITTTDGMLYITAENGVADATTDDLDEGTTNFYFTDQRAIDALAGEDVAVATIEVNSIAKNVAFTTLVESTSAPEAVATFNKTEYRSVKYLVKMSTATHTHLSEVLVTLDSSDNIAMTEYAIVTSNGSLGDLTADVSGNDIRLIADVANANTTVKVFGTLVE